MREIESVGARKGGEPTFKKRRITIGNMLTSLARGLPLQAFADDYEIDQEHLKNALKDIADNLYDWMRPETVWELWADRADLCEAYTFAPSDKITDMLAQNLLGAMPVREWTTVARSMVEAMTKYHEYMNWEPYEPMLQDNGKPYPEDLGDTVTE